VEGEPNTDGVFSGRYLPLEIATIDSGMFVVRSELEDARFTTASGYSDTTKWTETHPTFTWLDEDTP
jgi:hypothetical protein